MNLALATYYPYHVTDERFFIYAFRLSAQRFSNIASDHQRSRKPRDVITILGLNHRFCPVAETMIKARVADNLSYVILRSAIRNPQSSTLLLYFDPNIAEQTG